MEPSYRELQQLCERLMAENMQLRALEETLRDREVRLRLMLRQLPVILATLDQEARFTSAMGAGLKALGLDENEVVGLSLQDYFGASDPEFPVIAAFYRALQGESVRFEAEWMNRFFEVSMQPLLDANGVITGVLGLALDRTDQRRLQLQMEQAQRLEGIGRLAGGIAHDFNNVLAAISGFAEIAQRQLPSDHPAQPALQQILNGVERASQMVSQLLAVASRRVISPQLTNLNELITESLPLLQRLIGEDIEIQTYLAPDLATVRIDPVQIQQVLLNLAANAREAMPTGGKLIIETTNIILDASYTETHWLVPSGDYVQLSVTDTGHGIPPEHLPRVFEPFFTTRAEGTGLGLAMVHGIIMQANGYIHVYSEPGKGATFKIYLPRVEQASQPLPPTLPPTQAIPHGQGVILLVEDNDSTRDALTQMARMLGYEVTAVATPQEAIQHCQRMGARVDLLITDVVLPQMRGSELAEQLKALKPDLRVLYISGHTANAIVERGELKPGVEFLEKPFTLATLAQRVSQILGRE